MAEVAVGGLISVEAVITIVDLLRGSRARKMMRRRRPISKRLRRYTESRG